MCGEVFDDLPSALLAEHGISATAYRRSDLSEPAAKAVLEAYVDGFIGGLAGRVAAWCVLGEPSGAACSLEEEDEQQRFRTWLETTYGDCESLSAAWRSYPSQPDIVDWDDAVALAHPDGAVGITGVENANKLYGAVRDRQRFTADRECARAKVFSHSGERR